MKNAKIEKAYIVKVNCNKHIKPIQTVSFIYTMTVNNINTICLQQ